MAKCLSNLTKCRECKEVNSDKLAVCKSCGASTRCEKDAVRGYTRCDSHGGPVPSRNFYGRGTMTTGSGSSFPITRLAAKYNKMITDGQLLSNRHAVNIIDDRIIQLAGRVDVDEAPERVKALYNLWKAYTGFLDMDQQDKAFATRFIIDAEFEKIYHDYMAWGQIFEALDLRRKMIESEVKILKEIKGVISAEDAYELVAKLLAATMRVVGEDPKRLKQVQYEFGRIIGEASDNAGKGFDEDDGGDGGEVGG